MGRMTGANSTVRTGPEREDGAREPSDATRGDRGGVRDDLARQDCAFGLTDPFA
jgi:hypothetical protein